MYTAVIWRVLIQSIGDVLFCVVHCSE